MAVLQRRGLGGVPFVDELWKSMWTPERPHSHCRLSQPRLGSRRLTILRNVRLEESIMLTLQPTCPRRWENSKCTQRCLLARLHNRHLLCVFSWRQMGLQKCMRAVHCLRLGQKAPLTDYVVLGLRASSAMSKSSCPLERPSQYQTARPSLCQC